MAENKGDTEVLPHIQKQFDEQRKEREQEVKEKGAATKTIKKEV